MIVYAESSAVVSWLLGEPRAAEVHSVLVRATRLQVSTLTRTECLRAIIRAAAARVIDGSNVLGLTQRLHRLESRCDRIEMDEGVLRRAGLPFPVEPVRTLDAIHLASVAQSLATHAGVAVLSFDRRVRENAKAMGCELLPAGES